MKDAPTVLWDGCTMEPFAALRWFECHPGTGAWLQGIITVAAVFVAIWMPWKIHLRETRLALAPQQKAIDRLRGALELLFANTRALKRAQELYGAEGTPELTAERAAAIAVGLFGAYQNVALVQTQLPELTAKADPDPTDVAPRIEIIQKCLDEQKSQIDREISLLRKWSNKPGIVASSLVTGDWLAGQLSEELSAVIAALQPTI